MKQTPQERISRHLVLIAQGIEHLAERSCIPTRNWICNAYTLM